MKSPKSRITYLLGYEKSKDGLLSQKISSISLTKKSVTKFSNCMHQLINLSGFERVFLDYLCEVMDEETNEVYISIHEKMKFLKLFESSTMKERSLESIKKAIASLKKHHILISFGKRGLYVVNPRYFYKSTEDSRKKIIKKYIEWVFGESKENESNYREAFGIKESVVDFAKNLKRVPRG